MHNSTDLSRAAAYRSKNRMVALSWRRGALAGTLRDTKDEHMTMQEADVGLLRCSQPLVGVMGQTSKDDERLMLYLSATSLTGSAVIFDARPRLSAEGNHVRGGGYEKISNYPMCTLQFCGIENIHSVRESFVRLHGMFSKVQSNNHHQDMAIAHVELGLRSEVDRTSWLTHLVTILQAAKSIASEIDHGTTCIVHCSDGWDRTSQLTSLPMLLLDPFYRTITVFQVLVEKEWLSFGHKFSVRCGADTHSVKAREDYLDKQRSPIFVQFLDCVWQIKKQFSSYFEFNDTFLIACLRHVYSGKYGTFLFDCERERVEAQCSEKTVSLWTEINVHRAPFINDDYDEVGGRTLGAGRKMYTDLQVEIPLLSLWPAYEELWRQGVVGERDLLKGATNAKNNKHQKGNEKHRRTSSAGSETSVTGRESLSSSSEFLVPQLPPRRYKATDKKVFSPPPPVPTRTTPTTSMNATFSLSSSSPLRSNDAGSVSGVPPRPKSKAPSSTMTTSKISDVKSVGTTLLPPPRPTSKAPEESGEVPISMMSLPPRPLARTRGSVTSMSSTGSGVPARPDHLDTHCKKEDKKDTGRRRSVMPRRDTRDDDIFDFA